MYKRQAKEQRSALLVVNLAGGSDELVFDGASLAYNHRGELLCRAASFAEDLIYISANDLFAPAGREHPAAVEDITTVLPCFMPWDQGLLCKERV